MRKPFVFIITLFSLLFLTTFAFAKERNVRVTLDVDLNTLEKSNNVKLWIPYPVSDENQEITNISINGNFSKTGIYTDSKYGNHILYAEWNSNIEKRILTYSFDVKRKEVITKNFKEKELSFSKNEFKKYLMPSSKGHISGSIKKKALEITKGKKTNLQKARAIYDWIVDNMYRDPNVKGCGYGDVEKLLVTLGGKCADIHSVFVALARASGVPAREVFGIRIPKGQEGEMTKAQHCWAEFYQPGYGWVVVDPADVRKIILEQKLTLEEAKPYREYYFGAIDENRIAFGTGRDIQLNPAQSGESLNYFSYPYAEADGKMINEDLYGFNIGYKISFRGI